jgi:putative flippase GtrA
MSNDFPEPSAGDERAEALRGLLPEMKVETPWRLYGMLLRIVFTVAAAIAVSAMFNLFQLMLLPKGWLTAAAAIGVAEWLIRKHHFFRTGIESGLWICGTFAFIFGLPSSGKVEAILVFATAAALSGWRMRNTFFGVVATILVIGYIAAKWDHQPLPAMTIASAIAIVAAFALRRAWQRPSTERLFAGLALAMPVTGYLATVAQRAMKTSLPTDLAIALIMVATAIALFACGVMWRDRVLLISATLSSACAAIELRAFFHYPAEVKLIAAGVLVAAIAVVLSRALRNATRGFVVTPVRVGAYDEAMQIGGIISVAPHGTPASHQHTGPELSDSAGPTDKSYGGGGAGGGY